MRRPLAIPAAVFVERNDALQFAYRTKKNLLYIEAAVRVNADVHHVTQIVNSLLGLIVFPKERNLLKYVEHVRLSDLKKKRWPEWSISVGDSNTLAELIRHLRNAASHGRIVFSSDSRSPSKVWIEAEDYSKRKAIKLTWKASIRADQLREFCLRFIDLIENTIG